MPTKSQVQPNSRIKKITESLSKNPFEAVLEAMRWTSRNNKFDSSPEFKNRAFRKRTAAEIIESGILTGCTDYALVCISLLKAYGLKTKYVEAIETEWLRNGGNTIKGHVFVEVKIGDNWQILDPQGGTIRAWYGRRYEIFGKGRDSWDLNINNFNDLKRKFTSFKKEYLEKIKKSAK